MLVVDGTEVDGLNEFTMMILAGSCVCWSCDVYPSAETHLSSGTTYSTHIFTLEHFVKPSYQPVLLTSCISITFKIT